MNVMFVSLGVVLVALTVIYPPLPHKPWKSRLSSKCFDHWNIPPRCFGLTTHCCL
jgi:hypothetical protein